MISSRFELQCPIVLKKNVVRIPFAPASELCLKLLLMVDELRLDLRLQQWKSWLICRALGSPVYTWTPHSPLYFLSHGLSSPLPHHP